MFLTINPGLPACCRSFLVVQRLPVHSTHSVCPALLLRAAPGGRAVAVAGCSDRLLLFEAQLGGTTLQVCEPLLIIALLPMWVGGLHPWAQHCRPAVQQRSPRAEHRLTWPLKSLKALNPSDAPALRLFSLWIIFAHIFLYFSHIFSYFCSY